MKAVVIQEAGDAKAQQPGKIAVQDIPEFKLRPDYIRVKVRAVALNPTDWKHIDYISDAGSVVGCDLAGTVEEIGPDVKADVKVGDAVYGVSHGSNLSNHEDGAFAERCLMKDGLFVVKPDNLSFEEAASMPVGVGTVGQAQYQTLGLPMPDKPTEERFPLLIYGGSTATGSLAIQFAKLSGLQVIATASPKNNAFLEKLGAEKVFDYNDPEVGKKINEYTGNKLRYVFDTIALEQSMKICAEALSSTKDHGELRYTALLPPKGFPREDVTTTVTMLYTAMDETYTKMGRTVTPDPEDREFIKKWWKIANQLIADGKIKHHPVTVGKGFEGVIEGLDQMRKGQVSATKLVYTIA